MEEEEGYRGGGRGEQEEEWIGLDLFELWWRDRRMFRWEEQTCVEMALVYFVATGILMSRGAEICVKSVQRD
jgi:hypothetical protein